jgi:PPE-repeat protein
MVRVGCPGGLVSRYQAADVLALLAAGEPIGGNDMDFALLPPEVNSARMYAGPGSGPMLAAATAWDGLAADLQSTASSYESAVAGLVAGSWMGPAASAMAAAAAPYVAWIRSAAAQAEQTANQATAAAAAYDAAFAETVPPPVVTANRSLLTALAATNVFGQNTPAIALTESQYAEMWAQDASAMYGYASASASATTLTPFGSPPSSTNSGGEGNQAAAVAQASATPAGTIQSAITQAQQALTAVPSALSGAATPAQAAPSLLTILDFLSDLSGLFLDPPASVAGLAVDSTALPYDVAGALTGFHTDDIVSGWAGIQPWPGTAPVPPSTFPVITNPGSLVSAGMGAATTVGKMSVPTAWAQAAPEIRALAAALPATSVAAVETSASSTGAVFSQMALAGMAGRALAGSPGTGGTGGAGRRERIGERVGSPIPKPSEPAQPESPAVAKSPAGGPITSIAAELRELASLRDSGILTEEEFTEQKRRLLPQ